MITEQKREKVKSKIQDYLILSKSNLSPFNGINIPRIHLNNEEYGWIETNKDNRPTNQPTNSAPLNLNGNTTQCK